MSIKKERIYRIFGKILFLLYIVFLIYFLFLAEWYGRTEVTEEYRYNLELFKEIRRFLTYREQLGMFTVLANLLGNIMIFVPYGFFISMAGKSMGFFKILFFSMALSLGVDRRLTLETPLMWLDKAATWQMAPDLGGAALVELILAKFRAERPGVAPGDQVRRRLKNDAERASEAELNAH